MCIIQSGARTGLRCDVNVKPGMSTCGRHLRTCHSTVLKKKQSYNKEKTFPKTYTPPTKRVISPKSPKLDSRPYWKSPSPVSWKWGEDNVPNVEYDWPAPSVEPKKRVKSSRNYKKIAKAAAIGGLLYAGGLPDMKPGYEPKYQAIERGYYPPPEPIPWYGMN